MSQQRGLRRANSEERGKAGHVLQKSKEEHVSQREWSTLLKAAEMKTKTPMCFREMEISFDLDKCSFRRVVEQNQDWTRSMRGEEVETKLVEVTLRNFAVMGNRKKGNDG